MSSAVFHEGFATTMPAIDPKGRKPTLLWVACGTDDKLIQPNRDFVAWAKGKGLDVTPVETPGGHTWLVWRDNLVHLAPLLFRK
jgi:enterochelin esterase family protein